jgi:hypothetical protein
MPLLPPVIKAVLVLSFMFGVVIEHLRSTGNIRRTHCDSLGASCGSLVEELPVVLW